MEGVVTSTSSPAAKEKAAKEKAAAKAAAKAEAKPAKATKAAPALTQVHLMQRLNTVLGGASWSATTRTGHADIQAFAQDRREASCVPGFMCGRVIGDAATRVARGGRA
jgi:membrane protein involved in colicin uptake